MKILFTSHLFLPKHSGGTEVYTFSLASEMRQRGHDVHVLACESFKTGKRNEVRFSDDIYLGLKVHRVFLNIMLMDDPVRSEYYNPYVEHHLIEYYRQVQPDVIHAHHLCYLSTAVITAAQKLKIPVVLTATDFWLICPDSQLLRWDASLCNGPTNIADCLRCYSYLSKRAKKYRLLLRILPDRILNRLVVTSVGLGSKSIWQFRVLKAASLRAEWNRGIVNSVDLFISPSWFLESMFLQNGLTNQHRLHVPFGVRPSLMQSDARKSESQEFRFGFIGTISKHKGLHILIEAFKGIDSSKPVTLKIYGNLEFDPPYGKSIRKLAKDDSRIQFLGTFPHEGINEVLRNIDVLVVPSTWYENTPLVIYSALAMETPVICTNLGGMAELVKEGANGLTFEVGNPESLQARMVELLGNRDLVAHLRPDRSKIQTINDNADQLEKAYQDLLKRNPAERILGDIPADSVLR
jgi:glycosyltransferase involved in cell wall biosynthesis